MGWEQLLFNVFSGIGIFTVGLITFLCLWAIILARSAKKDKDTERKQLLDMLNPEKRAEKLQEMVAQAEEQAAILRTEAKSALEPAAKIAEKVIEKEGKKDGDS